MSNLFQKYLTLFIIFLLLFSWGDFTFAAGTAMVQATIKITVCGNGVLETGEQCDGSALGGASCTSLGFSGGTLSCKPSCEFDTSACTTAGGGGGGGGYVPPPVTGIRLSGKAYPLSKVSVLKDGQLAITTIAGPDANFNISLEGLSAGNYIFAVYGEDDAGRRSTLFTFPIYITAGTTTNITGIFIAPTIDVDKSEVKKGEVIKIFGQSIPNSDITVIINSDEELYGKTRADKIGAYLYNLDTLEIEMGDHLAKSRATLEEEISLLSRAIGFIVGTKTVLKETTKCPSKADLNNDCRVNLVDFSIAAYWYKRSISAEFAAIESQKLNNDGKVDLVDFSIMAYYWTG